MFADLVPALIAVVTAAATALIAGVISYIAGRGMKKHEWQLQMLRERLVARETLYADFLATASHYSLRAIDHKVSGSSEFSDITMKFERICLVASKPVADAALALCEAVFTSHARKPDEEKENDYFSRKQTLIREARNELDALAQ